MMKDKRAQETKFRILKAVPKNVPQRLISSTMKKKAQEEIVGFTMIIVLVAVILVIFLSFSMKNPQKENVESYEVENYLQALLQKTSDCRDLNNLKYYPVKDLIFKCNAGENCLDDRKTCEVLVKEIGIVSNQSWYLGKGSPIKGYALNITVSGEQLKAIKYGNQTKSYKGAEQSFIKESKEFIIDFKAYY